MDCSPPGSSVHWISLVKRLDWVAISFFRGSSWHRDQMQVSYVSCIAGRFFYRLSHQGSPLELSLHPYRAASKITADGDFSHEIKRCWLLGRKAMTNLDRILKSRDITLPIKVCLVKAMIFPVVMCGYESWTVKKADCWRIDAFELWCWRRILRVSWTARRSNQSILKEINPEYLLEGLMLKLKLQYFGHLMWRTDSFEKTLMLGKIEGRRRRGWDSWMASLIRWTWVSAGSRSCWCTVRKPGVGSP